MSAEVLTGRKFGRWLVVSPAKRRKDNVRIFWKCVCDCGNSGIVDSHSLKSGHSKSCGCTKRERPRILPNGVSEINLLLRNYVNGAERRGLDFSLTKEQFTELVLRDCFYCGISPAKVLKANWLHEKFLYNGIDRIDNSIGYIYSNCVSCCEVCNKAKRDLSQNEFYSWIQRVYKHRRRD